jgi:hypothetical protein
MCVVEILTIHHKNIIESTTFEINNSVKQKQKSLQSPLNPIKPTEITACKSPETL